MPWNSLADRIDELPLLLAGPIVRRVDKDQASIWFALKEDKQCQLSIFAETDGAVLMQSELENGVAIGESVFIYCLTAKAILTSLDLEGGINFFPGRNYYYNINFEGVLSLKNLIQSGELDITYGKHSLPSFCLPPNDINDIRIAHGSCRKPHGEGYDAMEGIHSMLEESLDDLEELDPVVRPHLLFLTGDQIYADDVADVLLYMIDDAAKTLFKWDEQIFLDNEIYLSPGHRNDEQDFEVLRNDSDKPLDEVYKSIEKLQLYKKIGLSAMIKGKPKNSKSHLLKFREYATMYLFAWSNELWPNSDEDFPKYLDVHPNTILSKRYGFKDGPITVDQWLFNYFEEEVHKTRIFRSTILHVRKALANVPTYMIFDDHEVTDDWNLNWEWCRRVYSNDIGKRVIHNGLLAYALFQAWGNTPKDFQSGPGSQLLANSATWRGLADASYANLLRLLSIPSIAINDLVGELSHSSESLNWHFNLKLPEISINLLDTRTWRSYLANNSPFGFPTLISLTGLQKQLEPLPRNETKAVLIISPAPVIGVGYIEEKQAKETSSDGRMGVDAEAWGLETRSINALYSSIEDFCSQLDLAKIIFLSGDVHYGLSARHQRWKKIGSATITTLLVAQLTASSFKNETRDGSGPLSLFGTRTLHYRGYVNLSNKMPDPDIAIESNFSSRTDWILGDNTEASDLRLPNTTPIDDSSSPAELIELANTHKNHAETWSPGKEIVGVNNFGEVRFGSEGQQFEVYHLLWWRFDGEDPRVAEPILPLTKYVIGLNPTGDETHKGEVILAPNQQ